MSAPEPPRKALSALQRFQLGRDRKRAFVWIFLGFFATLVLGAPLTIWLIDTGHDTLALFPMAVMALLVFALIVLVPVLGGFGLIAIPFTAWATRAFLRQRTAQTEADATIDVAPVAADVPQPLPLSSLSADDLACIEAERAAFAAKLAPRLRLYQIIAIPVLVFIVASKLLGWWGPPDFVASIGALFVIVVCIWYLGPALITYRYQLVFDDRFAAAFLPLLLAHYGKLKPVQNHVASFQREAAVGVVPSHARAAIGSVYAGEVRGAAFTLAHVTFMHGGDKRQVNAGARMIITLTLDGHLPGTTAVCPVTMARRLLAPVGLQEVTLEDPDFASVYQVFGSDPVGPRALLTPAAMRVLLTLCDGTGYALPALLAEGKRMVLAVSGPPLALGPGSVLIPGMEAHVRKIEASLAAVLTLAAGLCDVAEHTPGVRILSSLEKNP
jgi:hypothetical protein